MTDDINNSIKNHAVTIKFQKNFYKYFRQLSQNRQELIKTELQESLRGNNKFKDDKDSYLKLNQLDEDEYTSELDRILQDVVNEYEVEELHLTSDEDSEGLILCKNDFVVLREVMSLLKS